MNAQLDALYREVVLDHHRDPRGNHPVTRIDAKAQGHNPSCGDDVEVQLQLDDDQITDVGVCSHGCAISVASGSMLAELLSGSSIEQAERVAAALQRMLRGDTEALDIADSEELDDLAALAGVRQFPARIKCAALPWMTLLEALRERTAAASTSAQPAEVTTEDARWTNEHGRTEGAVANSPERLP